MYLSQSYQKEAALEDLEDSDDEYNVDASRSYHEPDEIVKHLTMPSSSNKPQHLVVQSDDYDDDTDEYPKSPKFSAMDMDPEDRIDPKHQAQACQWIEELMGIKINNKLPPKFSTIDENEEKDYMDPEEAKAAQGMIHVSLFMLSWYHYVQIQPLMLYSISDGGTFIDIDVTRIRGG